MNYTELKVSLMQHGAIFTKSARQRMHTGRFGHINFRDYATTGGVVFRINQEVYVNVPVMFDNTPFSLDYENDEFVLKMGGDIFDIKIEIIPAPQYALDNYRLPDGAPVRELVMTHADRLRISPVSGCSFHCQFCTCDSQMYRENSIENLDRAVEVALKDAYNRPEHILISGGTVRASVRGYEYMNQVYSYFPRKYQKYEFDVMLSPRGKTPEEDNPDGYQKFLGFLHGECGISTLSVNYELYHLDNRKAYIPDKFSIGKENYLSFLQSAVKVFGEGKIRSSLIVGIEDKEGTLEGVKEILSCGCMPVLSAFVPAPATAMARFPKPEAGFLLDVLYEADLLAKNSGIPLGPICKPCTHNSLNVESEETVPFR